MAIPASSAMRAITGAFRLSSSQPRRIFSVTGTSTEAATAARIAPASGSSRISAEPDSLPVTFFAGQPILISMKVAPRSAAMRAASAMICGSQPASCTDSGTSLTVSMRSLRISLRTSRRMAALATISVTTRPPPARRTARRNGMSVTPDIGARMAACGTVIPPMVRLIASGSFHLARSSAFRDSGDPPSQARDRLLKFRAYCPKYRQDCQPFRPFCGTTYPETRIRLADQDRSITDGLPDGHWG